MKRIGPGVPFQILMSQGREYFEYWIILEQKRTNKTWPEVINLLERILYQLKAVELIGMHRCNKYGQYFRI